MHYMKAVVVFLALCSLAFAASPISGPSSALSENEKSALAKLLSSTQKKDGSFLGLKNTYYAVSALKSLKQEVPNKATTCEFARDAKVADVESIFYQTSILESLSCGQSANDKTKTVLKAALASSSLVDLYYGSLTAALLIQNKHIDLSAGDLKPALDKILSLNEEGLFKLESESSGSVYGTALALDALAALASSLPNEKSRIQTALDSASSNVFSLADENEDTLSWNDLEGRASDLKVTALLFRSLNALAKAINHKTKEPTAEQVNGIAEFLVEHKQVATAEDAHYLLQGLRTAADNVFAVPVVVTVDQPSVSLSAKGEDANVKVRVTDVLSNAAIPAKVTLTKAYKGSDSSKPVLSNVDLTPAASPKGAHQFNLLTGKPEAGLYTLVFKVTPTDTKQYVAIDAATRGVKVLGKVELVNAQVTVSDSNNVEDKSAKKSKAEYPKALTSTVSAEIFQHVFVSFELKQAAHQVFVRLSSAKSGAESIAVAKKSGKTYTAHFAVQELADDFSGVSGDYDITVIIGDAFIENPISWNVGKVALKFPADAGVKAESPFAKKPEIVHKFRVPEKRPSKAISSAFTLAALAPLGLLILGWMVVGVNLRNFPTGAYSLSALAFQICLGAIFSLYLFYWLGLTMLTTLTYLGVLLVPTFYFANQTLNYLAGSAASKAKVE